MYLVGGAQAELNCFAEEKEMVKPLEEIWESSLIRNMNLEPDSFNTGQVTQSLCASVSSSVNGDADCSLTLWVVVETKWVHTHRVCGTLPRLYPGRPAVWNSQGTSSPLMPLSLREP